MRWVQHVDNQEDSATLSPSSKYGFINSIKCRVFLQMKFIEAATRSRLIEVAKKSSKYPFIFPYISLVGGAIEMKLFFHLAITVVFSLYC